MQKCFKQKPDYATFHDGYDISCIVDAIVESQQKGKWVKLPDKGGRSMTVKPTFGGPFICNW